MFERFTVMVGCASRFWEVVCAKFKLNILQERESKEMEEEVIL